jgi:hypothetical protein
VRGAVTFGEQVEAAADVDGGELGGVADQQHLPTGAACLLDDLDQISGGDHGGLVDKHERGVGQPPASAAGLVQPPGGVLRTDVRLVGEHPGGGLRHRQPHHVAAVVLPGGDDRAQGAGLARTGRTDQQPDTLLGAEQVTDGGRLVGAEVVLDDRRVDDGAGGCASGRLDCHVEQPALLVQRQLERPPLPRRLLVHARAVAAPMLGRGVDHVWCGHAHQLRVHHRPGDEPLRLRLQLDWGPVAGWQDIERCTQQVVTGERRRAAGCETREQPLHDVAPVCGVDPCRSSTEHLDGEAGEFAAVAAGSRLPRRQRLGRIDVALALTGLRPSGLRHRRQHRGRRVHPVLAPVGSRQLFHGGGDRAATRRERLDQLVVHPVQLAQPVRPVAPRDPQPAGQLHLEGAVVQRAGAGARRQQHPPVQRPPLAILEGLAAVEDQAVGVQVHVPVAGGPLVHPRHHQPGGIQHAHPVAARANVGGVLLQIAQPSINGGQVGCPHLPLEGPVAGRPQQRHALGGENVQSHAATDACGARRRISWRAIHRSYASVISEASSSASALAAAASSGRRNRRPRCPPPPGRAALVYSGTNSARSTPPASSSTSAPPPHHDDTGADNRAAPPGS